MGLTFASSIPAAVISMAFCARWGRGNILENNMVQTQASAAGTLSSVIFVMPGLVMVGHWHGFPFWQSAGVCVSGGVLGVLFTIPLRRAMVVGSDLPYPEGVAAAEILRVGAGDIEAGEPGAADIAVGGVVAGARKLRRVRAACDLGRDKPLGPGWWGHLPTFHRVFASVAGRWLPDRAVFGAWPCCSALSSPGASRCRS